MLCLFSIPAAFKGLAIINGGVLYGSLIVE